MNKAELEARIEELEEENAELQSDLDNANDEIETLQEELEDAEQEGYENGLEAARVAIEELQ